MLGTEAEQEIWTPDRRLRVFVSSTLGELAPERAAVKQAIEQLRLSPIMFELGARPHPPRALYRSYLAQSDVFLGIYWQRYGWVAPDMTISGLEDELLLSGGKPRLIYCKRPATDMEPRLADLLARLQEGDSVSYRPFRTADELHELVLDDLALMLTERFGAVREPRSTSPASLPEPATTLHGRVEDVAHVSSLLRSDRRLVTLTGLGGVGKTRLALAVASRLRDQGSREVAFVDLSPVTDAAAVVQRIAAATGAREEGSEDTFDALVRRLADRPWLVVLDNFEQVIDAGPELTKLLEHLPRLQLLVTSRVLLRLRGEVEHPVRPLAVSGAEQSPAVALFGERAQAARVDFKLDATNAADVDELCRRLDGLPLALELVAPQVRLFTPGQLLERLADWLEGDAMQRAYADLPERQRTLRATVDWSWELLSRPARTVFARLSVFSGAFTMDAAIDVCTVEDVDVTASLAELLDHSLISMASRSDGQPAFRMLDTIRAQARTRLGEDEREEVHARLESYLVTQLSTAYARLHSGDQSLEVRRLNDHVADMATVLGWLLEKDRPLGPLLGAISSCWVWAQITGELRRLPDFAYLIDSPSGRTDDELAVICWMHMGRLMTMCRFEEVAPFVRDHHALLERLDPAAFGMALVVQGLGTAGDVGIAASDGHDLLVGAVEVLRESGQDPLIGYGLSHLGDARLLRGDLAGARASYDEALAIGLETGDTNLRAEATYHLSILALVEGATVDATGLLRESAEYYVALDHRDGIARCLAVAAGIQLADGHVDRAARTFGVVEGVREPLELRPWPMVTLIENRWRDEVRDRLGPAEFNEVRFQGRVQHGIEELVSLLGLTEQA